MYGYRLSPSLSATVPRNGNRPRRCLSEPSFHPPDWRRVPSWRNWPEEHHVSVSIVRGRIVLDPRSRRAEWAEQSYVKARSSESLRNGAPSGSDKLDAPVSVRSRRTTVFHRVTAACMAAMRAASTMTSQEPPWARVLMIVRAKQRICKHKEMGAGIVKLSKRVFTLPLRWENYPTL
ncbi:hypothetical protein RHMOL_Rhmol05G0276700 [Rhododendron molle]|uniref:Uncharacterized protein n=1 Tax=Rhododendron molle TaxID=49168 RepID=A0ACC0NUS8_RHOML|nr:hypothetical protein RHMOL_Rhmol05G0276700 [Rhododendron molle]